MNVVVIAPHPDDEAVGCGGAVCLHANRGDRVVVAFLTSGERGIKRMPREQIWSVREREAEAAAEILGVQALKFLRRPDGSLLRVRDDAAAALRPVLAEENPQLIYLPHSAEQHPDHRAALPIVQSALSGSDIPTPTLRAYEIWTALSEYEVVEDITSVIRQKLRAIRSHRSQVRQLRYDRALRGLCQYRGTMARTGYSEVFQLPDLDAPAPELRDGTALRQGTLQFQRASQEINSVIPPGSAVILVDEDPWGSGELVAGRTPVRFFERDGGYYTHPPDDATAIGELERMRNSGAHFIAFARPAFWWLDYYSGLRSHLRSEYTCLIESRRLMVFDISKRSAGSRSPSHASGKS